MGGDNGYDEKNEKEDVFFTVHERWDFEKVLFENEQTCQEVTPFKKVSPLTTKILWK